MKKLFIFDIDGTVVNSERNVVPSTIIALQQAHEAGHEIGIVSGRNFTQMDDVLTSLPFVKYVGTINGGIIRDLGAEKEYIFAKPIKHEVVEDFLEIAQRIQREFQCANNDVFYRVYFGTDPKKEVKDPLFFKGGSKTVVYTPWEEVKDLVPVGEYLHLAVKAEGDAIKAEFAKLQEKYQDSTEVNIVTASNCYIECDPYGISKDGAIKFIQQLSGIENKDTYYFGDSGNDIKALDYVGNAVVMGNAHSVIKQHAKYIIGDHDSDAIHDFVMNVINYEE